jgi:hypothetical protein
MGMLAEVVGCTDPGVKIGLRTDWRRRRGNPGIEKGDADGTSDALQVLQAIVRASANLL